MHWPKWKKNYTSINQNLSANLVTGYKLFTGFMIRASFGYNTFTVDEISITPRAAIDPANSTFAFSQFANSYRGNWIVEPQAEYTCTILMENYKRCWVLRFRSAITAAPSMQGSGYTSDLLLSSLSAAGSVTASNSLELYHYNAFFGRINYNWGERYLFNLSARRDGSSRFGPGRRFANFGAIGAAWIFTSERWLHIPFISFGKLRGSYGITGNDQVGDYKYLDLWSSTAGPYQGIPGLRPSALFNPDFNWEKNKKFEAAVEHGFLNDKIALSASWYRHRSSNQLVSYLLPNQTGFASVTENLPALVQNTGWEIVLQSSLIAGKKFSWRSSLILPFLPTSLFLSRV
ncbi:MAG: TonB-dependent receptor [Bacteroidota bacterium]